MFNLTDDFFQSLDKSIFNKGKRIFNGKEVHSLIFTEEELSFKARVMFPLERKVHIVFDTRGDLFSVNCDCIYRYFFRKEKNRYCEHVIATLLAIREKYIQFPMSNIRAKSILHEIFNEMEKSYKPENGFKELMLDIVLICHNSGFGSISGKTDLRLKVGEKRTYFVKDISEFLNAFVTGKELDFTKKFTYEPCRQTFSPRDRSILEMLRLLDETVTSFNGSEYRQYGAFKQNVITLPAPVLKNILSQLVGSHISMLTFDGKEYSDVPVIEGDLPLHFNLEKSSQNLLLQLRSEQLFEPLTVDNSFIFYEGSVISLADEKRNLLNSLMQGLDASVSRSILVPAELKERFAAELLPTLKQDVGLRYGDGMQGIFIEESLHAEVYLDSDTSVFSAELFFCYGERRINPYVSIKDSPQDERILVRDRDKEKEIIRIFENSDFIVRYEKMCLDDDEKIFQFVYHFLPELQEKAEVYYSDRFKEVKIRKNMKIKAAVGLDSSVNLLEFSFELEGVEREELFDLLSSIREKRKYYRLQDGSYLPLQSTEMTEMAMLLEELELKKSDLLTHSVSMPLYRAVQLEQVLGESSLPSLQKSADYKAFVARIRQPQKLNFPYPAMLENRLRDYQKTGYKWFKALASSGFGGILADDMGLGKTLQALTFIASERENNKASVLVVAPTSVIFNWKAEAEKFTPGLQTEVISGNRQERETKIVSATAAGKDILITSYALLRRDLDLYGKLQFSHCFLDEAQNIKNPYTKSAAAFKNITAQSFWALTGTPLENSLSELWSIFNCVLPGYLPPLKRFIKRYCGNDDREKKILARKISPFILRRLKKHVLQELPPKIETEMLSELTLEQKKLYMAYVQDIRQKAATEISKQGFQKSRILILSALTRLRQICCHPLLFVENYKGDSGKFIQVQELLEEMTGSGHRILLFSQFTGMLKIIRGAMEKSNLSHFYLDGFTKTNERMNMVDAFNNGEKKVFLISLKAGGTGLNLTGADVVILYDLWWNPAVETQAADRAHRIGQQKTVQVIRMISMGTIEEKIFELQQKKKELIDKVIQPGETFLSALSEEEIRLLLDL